MPEHDAPNETNIQQEWHAEIQRETGIILNTIDTDTWKIRYYYDDDESAETCHDTVEQVFPKYSWLQKVNGLLLISRINGIAQYVQISTSTLWSSERPSVARLYAKSKLRANFVAQGFKPGTVKATRAFTQQ